MSSRIDWGKKKRKKRRRPRNRKKKINLTEIDFIVDLFNQEMQ